MARPLDERINKPSRVLIAIAIGVGMIVIHRILPGWEQVFLATVAVIGFILVQFRELWGIPLYWALLMVACIIHACIMIWLRTLMNEFRFFSTLVVVLGESFIFFVLFRRLLPWKEVDDASHHLH